jgi:hypothetical protein
MSSLQKFHRRTNGAAVAAVVATQGDQYWDNVVVLRSFEAPLGWGTNGFRDNGDEGPVQGVGMTQTGTSAAPKFGTYSLDTSGNSATTFVKGALTPYNSNHSFGNGAFTIEFWMNNSRPAANQVIMGYSTPNRSQWGWYLLVDTANKLTFYAQGGLGDTVTVTTASAIPNNTWNHIAIQRSSATNVFSIYVNGILSNSITMNIQSIYTTVNSSVIVIGGSNQSPPTMLGYTGLIDELRITKGVARYSSTFTVPTAQFPRNKQGLPYYTTAPSVPIGFAGFAVTTTANPGVWANTPTISYQWQNASTGVYLDIAGATNALSPPMSSRMSMFRCKITATDASGTSVAYTNPIWNNWEVG